MVSDELKALYGRIGEAARRARLDPTELQVVLVTKQVDPKLILEAYALGVRDFGENRVQDWLEKKSTLPNDIRWHLIGHLQTNKTKSWVGETHLVHSIDSEHLAASIEAEAEKKKVPVDALIQVNTSGEASKFGVAPGELSALTEKVLKLKNIRLKGVMTIGPLTEDQNQVRASFRKLRELLGEMKTKFPKENWKYLSMGMSSDFEIAIEEGANLLRIGTAVFGERQK